MSNPAGMSKTTSTTRLKADGMPDKRYKTSQTTKSAGPTKKDGTANMRYKTNKTVKTSTSTTKTKM